MENENGRNITDETIPEIKPSQNVTQNAVQNVAQSAAQNPQEMTVPKKPGKKTIPILRKNKHNKNTATGETTAEGESVPEKEETDAPAEKAKSILSGEKNLREVFAGLSKKAQAVVEKINKSLDGLFRNARKKSGEIRSRIHSFVASGRFEYVKMLILLLIAVILGFSFFPCLFAKLDDSALDFQIFKTFVAAIVVIMITEPLLIALCPGKEKVSGRIRKIYGVLACFVFVEVFFCAVMACSYPQAPADYFFLCFNTFSAMLTDIVRAFVSNFSHPISVVLGLVSLILVISIFWKNSPELLGRIGAVTLGFVIFTIIALTLGKLLPAEAPENAFTAFLRDRPQLLVFLPYTLITARLMLICKRKFPITEIETEKTGADSSNLEVVISIVLFISLLVLLITGKSGGIESIVNNLIGDLSGDYYLAEQSKTLAEYNNFISVALVSLGLTVITNIIDNLIFKSVKSDSRRKAVNIAMFTTVVTILFVNKLNALAINFGARFFELINDWQSVGMFFLYAVLIVPVLFLVLGEVLLIPLLTRIDPSIGENEWLFLGFFLMVVIAVLFKTGVLGACFRIGLGILLGAIAVLISGLLIYLIGFSVFAYLFKAVVLRSHFSSAGPVLAELLLILVNFCASRISGRYSDGLMDYFSFNNP